MILGGAAIATPSGAVMAAFPWAGETHSETVVIPQVVAMLGVGLVFPNCQAGAIGPFPTMAGAASSLLGFSQMGVAAAVGLGIGHTFDGTARPMATGMALAALAKLLSFRLVGWPVSPGTGGDRGPRTEG